MPEYYWQPKAQNRAQVSDATVDTVDGTPSSNDFSLTIGGVSITVPGNVSAAQTAADLVSSASASTHPYFLAIQWSDLGAGQIRAIANEAGAPFVVSLSVAGAGAGTVTDFSDTTPNSSIHDVADPVNWGGLLPVGNSDVVIADTSISMLYGLEALATLELRSIRVDHSFSGRIGLEKYGFATSLDGQTVVPEAPEYRPHYWRVDCTDIVIGRSTGLEQVGGSELIKIDNVHKTTASLLRIIRARDTVSGGRPAIRYLVADPLARVEVALAAAGVGLALDEPGEVAQVQSVVVTDSSSTTRVILGDGVTLDTWAQQGGQNTLNAAADVASCECNGGELSVIGEGYSIASMVVNSGEVSDSHINPGLPSWGSLVTNGGSLDLTGTEETRIATTMQVNGGTVSAAWDSLTIGTYTQPAGLASVSVQGI